MTKAYQQFRGSALRQGFVGLRRRLRDRVARSSLLVSGDATFETLWQGPPAKHRMATAEFVNVPGRSVGLDGASIPGEIRRYRGALRLDPQTGTIYRGHRAIPESNDGHSNAKTSAVLRMLRARPRSLPGCVSFLHLNAANYFHAVAYVLPRRPLLDLAGIDAKLPIVIAADLARQPFFAGVIEAGYFAGRELVEVAAGETIVAAEIVVVRPEAGTRATFDLVLDGLGLPERPTGQARIFIRRGARAANSRLIRNEAQLIELLAGFGFAAIDPQDLSFRQQVELFAAAACIVSQHGAGLTNMLYRRGSPLHVVELFSPGMLNTAFLNIANEFGYRYSPFLNRNAEGGWKGASDADLPAIAAFLATALPGASPA